MYQSPTKPKVQVKGRSACSTGLIHYVSCTDVNISLLGEISHCRELHQAGLLIFNQNILEYKKKNHIQMLFFRRKLKSVILPFLVLCFSLTFR